MQDKKEIIWSAVVVLAVVILVGLFAFFGRKDVVKTGFFEGVMSLENLSAASSCPLADDKDAFAKCLTEKGWTLYGAEWCSHCKEQKALFGNSFQYIKYVECPDNIQLCSEKGINGYPTWRVEK